VASTARGKRLYLVPILTKTFDILELLQNENGPMTLDLIHKRTGASKSTIYRILKTLVHRGYVKQARDGQYRHVARPTKLRFGFAALSAEQPFVQAVTSSLRDAAAAVGVDLLVLDNKFDAATAISNADLLIRERVDVVIEFQIDEHAAPVIADKISAARIPFIAIDIPHPDAVYFGVDNYRAGLEAGRILADFASNRWGGRMDWMLGLDVADAGQLVQNRITGAFEGVRSGLPEQPVESFVRVDCRGLRDTCYEVVSAFLKRHPNDKNILIAAVNDSSALGAVEAARELGRTKDVAIVGQDSVDEMLREIQSPDSPAIGTISHDVSQYGPRLMELGLAMLRGETVSPYNYVSHQAITAHRGGKSREVKKNIAKSVPPKSSKKKSVSKSR
jgi:ribose transport system substrate-binding protein